MLPGTRGVAQIFTLFPSLILLLCDVCGNASALSLGYNGRLTSTTARSRAVICYDVHTFSRVQLRPHSKIEDDKGKDSVDGTPAARTKLQPNNPRRHHDGDGDSNSNSNNITPPENTMMSLLVDGVAIVLASQLIGLLDILNNPEFVANGGWFQPLPAVPSSLGLLVQRIASLGTEWILAVVIVTDLFGKSPDKPAREDDDNKTTVIKMNDWLVLAVFCGLRLLVGFLVSSSFLADGTMNTLVEESNDWLLTSLRDCYYVGLLMLSLRYLYRLYFP
ncbi:hypothetical protein IV203_035944 [Nitzschia inconspicua]|uniref:Uncharacterized protein n=1 Tax=Nitzschia inconspicua TaxID=303405 RepID=A0A9K3LE75_9STRA|nr:hypothetical protein IV203_035944 [Nitzschia inconspicua]